MDRPSAPADPLAQPTRARLLALLADARRPATTEELAKRLELHPNGVRNHLERLHAARLIERRRERQARGRPRDTWVISADALPRGERPTAYAELAAWLARSIAEGAGQVPDVEAVGRRIGRELAAGEHDDPQQRLHDILASLGFQPERVPERDGRVTYRLRNCPYRDVARERQPIVCGLHRGLTRGLLDELDADTELDAFVPRDPGVAGCLIVLRGESAERDHDARA